MEAQVSGTYLGFEIFASSFVLQIVCVVKLTNSNWAPIVSLHVLDQKKERDWFKLREPHGIIRCSNVLFTF